MGRWTALAVFALFGIAGATLFIRTEAEGQEASHTASMMTLPDSGTIAHPGPAFHVTNTSTSLYTRAILGEISSNGTAVLGLATGQSGRGLIGQNTYVGPTALTTAVMGLASSDWGTGLYGSAGQSGSGQSKGVYGVSRNSSGMGVYGFGSSVLAGAAPYGVLGFVYTESEGIAVYASGDMGASGTKAFRIDHPLDPKEKYLLHYAAEGPVPQNVYNGVVTTDTRGYAWVQLPSYFEAINKDLRYSLTVLDSSDDFVLAKVTRKVENNRFQIRTSKPGVEVSWEVKGARNDLYVRYKQPKDVIDKPAAERGKYQHPELYGEPASEGTFSMPDPLVTETEVRRASKSSR